MPAHDVLKLRILACKSTVNIICKAFERQAAQNNPFMFSEFIFSTAKVFFPINLGLSRLTFCCALSLVLCAQ